MFTDGRVEKITTKTDDRRWADTNDNIFITICDATGSCCRTELEDRNRDDFKIGAIDDFTDASALGECNNKEMKGQVTAKLEVEKNDGWFVNWAKISLTGGRLFTCNFNVWLDNDSKDLKITNSKQVPCSEGIASKWT